MGDKNRITAWLGSADLPWLHKEQQRIEQASGGAHKCRVVTENGKSALFYTNGYFDNPNGGAVQWFPEARPEISGKPQNVVQQAKECQPVGA